MVDRPELEDWYGQVVVIILLNVDEKYRMSTAVWLDEIATASSIWELNLEEQSRYAAVDRRVLVDLFRILEGGLLQKVTELTKQFELYGYELRGRQLLYVIRNFVLYDDLPDTFFDHRLLPHRNRA